MQQDPRAETNCQNRKLVFSADRLPPVPPRSPAAIWGGNATGGGSSVYSPSFLARARQAKAAGHQTFAYLEGPCGNTGGKDDGEVRRCARIHDAFNRAHGYANNRSQKTRWEPFTFKQLTDSGKNGIDHCEIDNLENNVKIPLMPFLEKYKRMYDAGQIHCKLVLKNLSEGTLQRIKTKFATAPRGVDFVSPFHIYESRSLAKRSSLNRAMRELKGQGAATVISTNTQAYGSAFSREMIRTCDQGSARQVQARVSERPARSAQRRPSSL